MEQIQMNLPVHDACITATGKPGCRLPTESGLNQLHQRQFHDVYFPQEPPFHNSRHTSKDLIMDADVGIFTFKELLGHNNFEHTFIYARIRTEKKSKRSKIRKEKKIKLLAYSSTIFISRLNNN